MLDALLTTMSVVIADIFGRANFKKVCRLSTMFVVDMYIFRGINLIL